MRRITIILIATLLLAGVGCLKTDADPGGSLLFSTLLTLRPSNPLFVATDNLGTVWYSQTGNVSADWWPAPISANSLNWLQAGGGTLIVADTLSSDIFRSADGRNWVRSGNYALQGPTAYGNGRFVMVGTSGTPAIWSADGATWYFSDVPTAVNLSGLAFGNGIFTAMEGGVVFNSASGELGSWTVYSPGGDYQLVAFGAGVFVKISTNGFNPTPVAISTDGINWASGSISSTNILNTLVYAGDRFIAASSSELYYSTDGGMNWQTGSSTGLSFLGDIAGGKGILVAVGTNGANLQFVYSTDGGITWSDCSPLTPSAGQGISVIYGP